MAFTKSLSLFTVPHSLSHKTPTSHSLFPKLPLKTTRNPLPVLSCTPPKLTYQHENTPTPYDDVEAYDGGDVEDEDEEMGSGICAVPKKRTSRSKTRIRKNVWKRKAYFAALKAYSLAKSISTGNSKSFLVIDKKK